MYLNCLINFTLSIESNIVETELLKLQRGLHCFINSTLKVNGIWSLV